MGSFPSAHTSLPTTLPGTFEPQIGSGTTVAGISIPTSIPGISVPYITGTSPPAPQFVVAADNPSANSLALAGTAIGDIIVEVGASLNLAAFTVGWWSAQLNAIQSAMYSQVFLHTVAAGESSPFTVPLASSGAYAGAVFRGILSLDGSAAENSAASSTSPTTNAFTTVETNDIIVNLVVWNGGSGTVTYTGSTGFTVGVNLPSVSGSHFGLAIEYLTGAAAGSQPASAGAVLSGTSSWIMWALGLCPLVV